MMRYQAYGLAIDSEIELWPELGETDNGSAADVRVALASFHARPRSFCLSDDTSTRIPDACALRVVRGCLIEVAPDGDTDEPTLAACAAGAGLGMILHQRGCCVLHGSCVSLAGLGVCFAGPSGVGKSTLATALAERGHALVSDGMTALATGCVAQPGPRSAKLWPDSIRHFGWAPDALPQVTPRHDKRFHRLPASDVPPTTVGHVFVVTVGTKLEFRTLAPAESLVALAKNAFLAEYTTLAAAGKLLERCADVVSNVRVTSLTLPDDLSRLEEVVLRVEDEICDGPRLAPVPH